MHLVAEDIYLSMYRVEFIFSSFLPSPTSLRSNMCDIFFHDESNWLLLGEEIIKMGCFYCLTAIFDSIYAIYKY